MSDEQTAPVEADDEQEGGGRKPSAATLLVELAQAYYEVFAAEDGAPYATALDGSGIALPLRGRDGLRQRLARLFYTDQGKAATSAALADALAVLEGEALEVDRRAVALRLARDDDGRIVLDLGTADGRCVIVAPGRWDVADLAPDGVLFRRTALTGELPTPERGGRVESLFPLLNCDEDAARLIVGWLVAALVPEIDHPILALFGEQGTAKTTALRTLVNLVDPSPAPTRTSPRDLGAWAVTASASWVVGLDNVSVIPEWFSDALCRAVTGDGVVSRALYSDADVSVLSFRRAIAMTSIDAGSLRGDLGERLLPVELQRIDPTERRTATEVNDRVAAATAGVLGGLLDLLAGVLAELPNVQTRELPRLADFARVLHALDAVTGWSTVADYADTASEVAAAVVDSDPFAVAVRGLLVEGTVWRGTTAKLHDDLLKLFKPGPPPRGWPGTAQATSARLKRVTPALRELGITVEHTRDTDRNRTRKVTIARDADGTGPCGQSADEVSAQVSAGLSAADTASDLGGYADADSADSADTPMRLSSHVVSSGPAVGRWTGWAQRAEAEVPPVLVDVLGARPISDGPADDEHGSEGLSFADLMASIDTEGAA